MTTRSGFRAVSNLFTAVIEAIFTACASGCGRDVVVEAAKPLGKLTSASRYASIQLFHSNDPSFSFLMLVLPNWQLAQGTTACVMSVILS